MGLHDLRSQNRSLSASLFLVLAIDVPYRIAGWYERVDLRVPHVRTRHRRTGPRRRGWATRWSRSWRTPPALYQVCGPEVRIVAHPVGVQEVLQPGAPFPPADVAVLHLRTGSLDMVPGLELPPETQAGLAFDTTGRWLPATVNEGDPGELPTWRQGMPAPALVTSLPGRSRCRRRCLRRRPRGATASTHHAVRPAGGLHRQGSPITTGAVE